MGWNWKFWTFNIHPAVQGFRPKRKPCFVTNPIKNELLCARLQTREVRCCTRTQSILKPCCIPARKLSYIYDLRLKRNHAADGARPFMNNAVCGLRIIRSTSVNGIRPNWNPAVYVLWPSHWLFCRRPETKQGTFCSRLQTKYLPCCYSFLINNMIHFVDSLRPIKIPALSTTNAISLL